MLIELALLRLRQHVSPEKSNIFLQAINMKARFLLVLLAVGAAADVIIGGNAQEANAQSGSASAETYRRPSPPPPRRSPPPPVRRSPPPPPPRARIGPLANQITSLPGLNGTLSSESYGGYINLNGTQKQIYYYLATSQRDPANDPLVIWVNGGPGDSSFIADLAGFGQEHGPYTFSLYFRNASNPTLIPDGVQLDYNPLSWNRIANMLYIDNPAGAGLSYSLNSSDYNTTDTQERIDLEQTVRQWLQVYPYFQRHNVFYSGESYGGQYITMLTDRTLERNRQGAQPTINLRGYMIGNAVTSDQLDNVRMFEIYTYLSLIPLDMYARFVQNNCNIPARPEPSYATNPLSADFQTFQFNETVCTDLFNQFLDMTANLYGYNMIYDPFYAMGTFESTIYNRVRADLAARGYNNFTDPFYGDDTNSPRTDDRAVDYWLNLRTVRRAIHAGQPESGAGVFYIGNARLTYNYDIFDLIPVHRSNIAAGVRALVYSGDHDGILGVPWPGSQTWTSIVGTQLGYRENGNWTTWYIADPDNFGDQTAGFITQYNGLTYMTVRAAGHQVPIYKPAEAYLMFSHFLNDTLNDLTTPVVGLLDIPSTD